MEEHMLKYRLDQIEQLVPWVMADRSDGGDWQRARGVVNMFNERRDPRLLSPRHRLRADVYVRVGASYGTLALIAYAPRKPDPLGTMFKCLLDNDTKVLAMLEIYEGG
uniref:Uncharacterized protein n=1 Tax=Micromonas pusilla TaxID=38833 RepID=A0A6U2BKG0_MICPS|mmetsp:Transcript_13501/g.53059  ORF Transcript_13501/g.53059 Transcript_13501/m.53059 type:complete len:108 (+) Transcript_13501:1806-2129(+)